VWVSLAVNLCRWHAALPTITSTTFPWSGAGWWGGGWPVGDLSGGYTGGGYYGYANPPQALAPQVIVISQDGQGRMTTAEAPADYTYVKGCHAIANGYHCDGRLRLLSA
jgi:hypothetical protein